MHSFIHQYIRHATQSTKCIKWCGQCAKQGIAVDHPAGIGRICRFNERTVSARAIGI